MRGQGLFAPPTPTSRNPARCLQPSPTVRRLDTRQLTPLDANHATRIAMTEAPSAARREAETQLADVISLPDQSGPVRTRKKITSGSNKRRRRHLEYFRTDDAEHAALQNRLNGESLGAFVMRLSGISSGEETRARRRGRSSVDVVALTKAMVEFSREHNNYNQAVRALNTLALVADDRSDRHIGAEIQRVLAIIEALQTQFAAPLAAIQAALGHVREG